MTRYETAKLADIEIHPDTRQLLNSLMGNPVIQNSMRLGGWLAGGFARQVLSGNSVKEYFAGSPGTYKRQGDVDIVFPNAAAAMEMITSQGDRLRDSFGGFAKETRAFTRIADIQIQLVNSPGLCHPLEDSLERFDFKNCKVAIKGDEIIFPVGWHDLEKTQLLEVANNSSPFLGSRIVKYIEHRDMKGITPSSVPLLADWIYRAAASDFPGYEERHLRGFRSAIVSLNKDKLLDPTFLTLFLGKWSAFKRVSRNYGHYDTVQVDWALSELAKINDKHTKV